MPNNRVSLFALAGGLFHIALSLSLLFLPVFARCLPQGEEMICEWQSYIQRGGNIIGFGFLFLMIAAGVMAIVSTRIENPSQVRRLRWLAVVFTVCFAVIGAWSIGLLFVPGGLLFLLSAILQPSSGLNRQET